MPVLNNFNEDGMENDNIRITRSMARAMRAAEEARRNDREAKHHNHRERKEEAVEEKNNIIVPHNEHAPNENSPFSFSGLVSSIVSAPWNLLKWMVKHPKQTLLLLLAAEGAVLIKDMAAKIIDPDNTANPINPGPLKEVFNATQPIFNTPSSDEKQNVRLSQESCDPKKLADEEDRIKKTYLEEVHNIQLIQERTTKIIAGYENDATQSYNEQMKKITQFNEECDYVRQVPHYFHQFFQPNPETCKEQVASAKSNVVQSYQRKMENIEYLSRDRNSILKGMCKEATQRLQEKLSHHNERVKKLCNR